MIKKVKLLHREAQSQYEVTCLVLQETFYLFGLIPVYRRYQIMNWGG